MYGSVQNDCSAFDFNFVDHSVQNVYWCINFPFCYVNAHCFPCLPSNLSYITFFLFFWQYHGVPLLAYQIWQRLCKQNITICCLEKNIIPLKVKLRKLLSSDEFSIFTEAWPNFVLYSHFVREPRRLLLREASFQIQFPPWGRFQE